MEAAGFDALLVFYPARVAYLTGFHFVPTERPVALLLGDGYTALVVPAVEKEHAETIPGIDRVEVYFEYPGTQAPMERVRLALADINASPTRCAADHDGYVPHWGYRGPRLSELTGHPVADGELLVEELRRVKSPTELRCIQLSCDWAVKAHRRMQDAIRTGRTEIESYGPAEMETLQEMIGAMPGWRPRGFSGSGLTAMFVGGRSTAMPHGFVRGRGIGAGDVLVSGAAADIDGYHSELERTMVVGEPSAAQRSAFEAMLALQTHAIDLLRPGRPVAEIDSEVRALARQLGHEGNLRHHPGHSIGLEAHEAPFLDRGDPAVLEEGMVFTVEPGLYLAELGGFRHSDTVAVTAGGPRSMTPYPRDLDSLIIPDRRD
ncbi:MAG: Xaa-Pro peptidase family protein [Candidatus Dormibacteraeota bacterium]|nr:Xaa-Pro peptidase family protein [Candidatus Dormibacteraeota bacterium]